MHVPEVLPILQLAIGPVILISGVGLLLLSITNRYGRVIDRVRAIGDGLRSAVQPRPHVFKQLEILMRRAKLLRLAITFGVNAVLFASLLIIGLFLTSLLRLEFAIFVIAMFSACILSLIVSLIYFLIDINTSLAALRLDYQDALNQH